MKQIALPGQPQIDWLNTCVKYSALGLLIALSFVTVAWCAIRFPFMPAGVDLGESLHRVWRPVLKDESIGHIFFGK